MSAYRHPHYGGGRRRTDDDRRQTRKLLVRFLVFAVVIAVACVLRLGKTESLQNFRQKVSDVISGTTDYRDAVETLGRAASGEKTEDGDNPIAVFGRMLLGLSEDTP